MTLALNTETLFLLIVILAGILSIPVLLLSKKNRKANSLLAGVQLAVAGSLFHNLLLAGIFYLLAGGLHLARCSGAMPNCKQVPDSTNHSDSIFFRWPLLLVSNAGPFSIPPKKNGCSGKKSNGFGMLLISGCIRFNC
jgi:hypothetical protein